jgi:hypothetical protein
MKLHLEWARPILLRDASQQNLIYSVDLKKLPSDGGVYIFGRRRRSKGFEALYVGKANNIRIRIRGQFKNLPLMLHLKNAKYGKRIILTGQFKSLPGQRSGKCLPLIERALIRYFLSEGHDLVNKQGARIRRHEIASSGKRPRSFIPGLIFLERHKGE